MITVKEEFLSDDKTQRAIKLGGYEVIAMWLAMKCYAASHATDGFIPAEDVESLPGAPRKARAALKALVECGRLQADGKRGAGLVDPVEHGWQLHDYLDHAASSDEIEVRRKKAREQKANRRAELRRQADAGQSPQTAPPDRHGQSPRTSSGQSTGPRAPAGTRPPAYGRTRDPSPAQPSPAQPIAGSGITVRAGRQKKARPIVDSGLLVVSLLARDWVIPEAFWEYASELGLNANEYESVLADYREKVTRSGSATWLADKLCRYIEAAHRPEPEPAAHRPPVILQREIKPIEMGEVPAEVLARISPQRALRGVQKSREQQIEELRAYEENASNGRLEPEEATGG